MQKNLEKTISDLIDKQNVSFISSIDKDGYPNTKAMLMPRKRNGLKIFYFTTNTSSMRVAQYRDNPKASIYFYDQGYFYGVLFKGLIEVLVDDDSKAMIWRDSDTMYYSLGVTDPDYCVLKFTASEGRYYANFNSEDFKIE